MTDCEASRGTLLRGVSECVGWLVSQLSWLVGWLVGWLVSWLVKMVCLLIGCWLVS